MKTVKIESGDDLYSLAEKHLGSHKYWRYVALINGLDLFGDMPLDTPLQIPDPNELQALIKAIDSRQPEQILSTVASATGLRQIEALKGLVTGKIDPSAIAGTILDLSGLKGGYGEFNIIDWII